MLSIPDAAAGGRGLGCDDLFTVVSQQFMTKTACYGDVILPAAMETEKFDVITASGHRWLGWNEPPAEPLSEAVSNTELFRRLAAAFGFNDLHLRLHDLEQIEVVVGDHVELELSMLPMATPSSRARSMSMCCRCPAPVGVCPLIGVSFSMPKA